MTLPGLRFRWLLRRAVGWMAVVATALALLALVVDWVEAGNSTARPGVPPLLLAVVGIPAHLVRFAPILVALGAALAVAGMRRSGEWQALAGLGLSPARRLGPFLVAGWIGGLGGILLGESVVPAASLARARWEAAWRGGPLLAPSLAWYDGGDVLYHLETGPDGSPREVEAFVLRDGRLARRLRAPLGGDAPGDPVFAGLPPPADLERMLALPAPSTRSSGDLLATGGPAEQAELVTRWSRAIGAGPAAVVGAALPAAFGPAAGFVLLGALPVLGWELGSAVVESQATLLLVPPWAPALPRLGAAVGFVVAILLILRRPARGG